jgi:hypothetical protein
MKITQWWDRHRSRRVAVVDAFASWSNVRHRFAVRHGELSGEEIRTVEAATRQWLRLLARHSNAELSMPSTVVNDMWRELVTDTGAYAALCQGAFGRIVDRPDPAANRPGAVLATLRRAREDEGCGPANLPLLFRVDRDLAVPGGRRYLADCGGRGECHELRGIACLEHLAGVGKTMRRDRYRYGRSGWTRPRVALYTKVFTSEARFSRAGSDLANGADE